MSALPLASPAAGLPQELLVPQPRLLTPVQAWAIAERAQEQGQGDHQLVLCTPVGGIEIYAVLQGGARVLGLVSLLSPLDPALVGRMRGMTGTLVGLPQAARQVPMLLLAAEEGCQEVFEYLAEDLYQVLTPAADPSQARALLLARLEVWAAFLRPEHHRELSVREARGVYAELRLLEQLAPVLGWTRALETWSGPGRAPWDVDLGLLKLDAKATEPGKPWCEISSVEQLDPSEPGSKTLLVQAQLVLGDDSLSAARRRVMDGATRAGVPGDLLGLRLSQAGLWHLGEDPLPLVEVEEWVIHDASLPDFPALRRAVLPAHARVGAYQVDLTSYPGPRLSIAQLLSQVSAL